VEPIRRRILELSYELGWRLVDLSLYGGQLPPGHSPQGAIVNFLPDKPLVRKLRELGCPTVRIGRLPHPEDHLVPAVMEDLPDVGRVAVEHFADRNFRHVGYVGRDPWADSRAIYDGLREYAAARGCECHLLRFKPAPPGAKQRGTMWRRREKQFIGWIRGVPKPLGLLAFGDGEAARLCMMCESGGVAVPRDVAVLGHDNMTLICECAQLTLSSVAPDYVRMAETAVDLLAKRMRGDPVAETTVVIPPAGVVTRESTDVLATPTPIVARALRFMWDHLSSDLSVDDIAGAVGVSRRRLERAFRRDLDRGINQELLRRRLERACELLRTTDMSIADLAPSLGFGSRDYFQRAFRRTVGVSPGRYRRNPA